MRKNKPIFLKEVDSFIPPFRKIVNIPKLEILSTNSISLFYSPNKEGRVPISRKELKQLVRIRKIGELKDDSPPQLTRKGSS